MSSNSNLPSIKVWVNSSYIYKDVTDPTPVEGFLVGVRCLQNQTYQFHVLLRNGAFYVGIPPHMLSFSPTINSHPLSDACMWDAVSSDIEVITYDLLRYMPCTVKLRNGNIVKAMYMFTLDCVGNTGLARDGENWKSSHILKAEDGSMLVYPQYRIKFTDKGLCDEDFPLPNRHNNVNWVTED